MLFACSQGTRAMVLAECSSELRGVKGGAESW